MKIMDTTKAISALVIIAATVAGSTILLMPAVQQQAIAQDNDEDPGDGDGEEEDGECIELGNPEKGAAVARCTNAFEKCTVITLPQPEAPTNFNCHPIKQ